MMWTLQCQQVAPKWFSRCSIVIPKKSLWSPSDVQVVSKGSPRGPPENHQMVPNIQVRYQFCILFSCFLLFWGAGREAVPSRQVFQYRVGSGIEQNTGQRVGFGSGKSVKKYDRVFPGIFFLSGFSGYFGYFWVFLGISGFTHIYQGYFLTFIEG